MCNFIDLIYRAWFLTEMRECPRTDGAPFERDPLSIVELLLPQQN